MTKERDLSIDVLRGLAAFMVVFTHVIQLYGDSSNNFVNNAMLSLQIPLFMMVSGYTSKYTKPIITLNALSSQVVKRSRLLLLPWFTWSLLLYIIYKSDVPILEHVGHVAYHMEGAYWFLFSLWCLNLACVVASYFNARFSKQGGVLSFLVSFIMVLGIFFVIGYMCGLSFLGIKYTLFYSLFFLLGYFLAKDKVEKFLLQGNIWSNILLFISFVLFFVVVCKVNVFELPETLMFILLRLMISLMGCLVLFYTVKIIRWERTDILTKSVLWGGQKSLEIYVIHYLFLRIFLKVSPIQINTVASMVETIEYFLILLVITYVTIEIIDKNPLSRLLLFGKPYVTKRF